MTTVRFCFRAPTPIAGWFAPREEEYFPEVWLLYKFTRRAGVGEASCSCCVVAFVDDSTDKGVWSSSWTDMDERSIRWMPSFPVFLVRMEASCKIQSSSVWSDSDRFLVMVEDAVMRSLLWSLNRRVRHIYICSASLEFCSPRLIQFVCVLFVSSRRTWIHFGHVEHAMNGWKKLQNPTPTFKF